jgi:hypothetical protein
VISSNFIFSDRKSEDIDKSIRVIKFGRGTKSDGVRLSEQTNAAFIISKVIPGSFSDPTLAAAISPIQKLPTLIGRRA